MRIVWTRWAVADRGEIFDYIEGESPSAAVAVDQRIAAAVGALSSTPLIGRPGRVEATRELVVGRTPFIVVYRVEPPLVRVLRVLHGARRWPDEF